MGSGLHSETLSGFSYFGATQHHFGKLLSLLLPFTSSNRVSCLLLLSLETLRLSSCLELSLQQMKAPPVSHCYPTPGNLGGPFKSQATNEKVPSHSESKQSNTGMRLIMLDLQSKC